VVATERSVFAVVLAAGRGERFGGAKQLAEIDGQPMVRRACKLARAVCGDNTLLVAGHDSAAVLSAAGDSIGFVVVNDHHEDGIGTSIAAGVRAIAHTAGGILLLLADQPLVTDAHLRNMIDCWDRGDDEVVATSFDGTRGPPVLFPPGAFDALMTLSGDNGARSLLNDGHYRVKTVACEDAAVDIDTPDQLETLQARAGRPPPVPGD
jgi:CTP:molybdopterin cytidylyltransferase MocA